LTDPSSRPEAGAAYYQLPELHRLRGEFEQADEAYPPASQAGHNPPPRLALLRLSQGQTQASAASLRLASQQTRGGRAPVPLLFAGVEIMLATNDVAGARAVSEELLPLAARFDVPFLTAVSSQVRGAVALAEGQPLPALESLRAASAAWQEVD